MALSQRRARLLGRLRSSKSRRREGLVLVEGVRAVEEALEAGASVRFALASPRLGSTEAGRALRDRLAALDLEVEAVADAELDDVSDTEHPQGVLAVCAEPADDPDALRAGGRYLALDGLQDPGNAGTVVRAAAAFGLDGVIGLEGTVDLWGAKAVRASAGTAFRARILERTWEGVRTAAEAAGLALLAAAPGGRDVRALRPPPGWVLVIGNEGAGLREAVLAAAAERVSIPMPGGTESLNAAVAGSILVYELTRKGGTGVV